jgi:hypothetical protein
VSKSPSTSKHVGVLVSCAASQPSRTDRKSVTRTQARDGIYPTKSQPFSIIWEDNTDSVVDLRRLLQYARNFKQGLHKPSNLIFPPTSNGARVPGTVVAN